MGGLQRTSKKKAKWFEEGGKFTGNSTTAEPDTNEVVELDQTNCKKSNVGLSSAVKWCRYRHCSTTVEVTG